MPPSSSCSTNCSPEPTLTIAGLEPNRSCAVSWPVEPLALSPPTILRWRRLPRASVRSLPTFTSQTDSKTASFISITSSRRASCRPPTLCCSCAPSAWKSARPSCSPYVCYISAPATTRLPHSRSHPVPHPRPQLLELARISRLVCQNDQRRKCGHFLVRGPGRSERMAKCRYQLLHPSRRLAERALNILVEVTFADPRHRKVQTLARFRNCFAKELSFRRVNQGMRRADLCQRRQRATRSQQDSCSHDNVLTTQFADQIPDSRQSEAP